MIFLCEASVSDETYEGVSQCTCCESVETSALDIVLSIIVCAF